MGLREWRGRRGPCVSGVWSRVSALQWINRLKKCRSWATLVRYLCSNAVSTSLPLTAQEQEHTRQFGPEFLDAIRRTAQCITETRRSQSDSGIITALHDCSRNARFHGKWGSAIVSSLGVSCAASNTYKPHSHHGRARLQNSSSSTSIPHSTHAFFVMPVSGSSTLRPHSCSCWPFPIVSPNSPPPPLLAFL